MQPYSLPFLPSLLFLRVKEKNKGRTLPPGETYLSVAIKRLVTTFKAVRHFSEFITFIISFLIYNDGILMALDFAAIIGAVLFGMTQTQLILFMILVQVTSASRGLLFGLVGERIGFKKSLLISLVHDDRRRHLDDLQPIHGGLFRHRCGGGISR